MGGVGGVALMRKELLYGGLGVLTREMLINVVLVERPEIHRLVTFEVGDADEIALADQRSLSCFRGHMNAFSDGPGSSHVAAPTSFKKMVQMLARNVVPSPVSASSRRIGGGPPYRLLRAAIREGSNRSPWNRRDGSRDPRIAGAP